MGKIDFSLSAFRKVKAEDAGFGQEKVRILISDFHIDRQFGMLLHRSAAQKESKGWKRKSKGKNTEFMLWKS